MSKASDLALAISTRIEQITIANGYATDIGVRVFRGRGSLNRVDLPCIVMVEGDETVQDAKYANLKSDVVFVLEGHDTCDPLHPNDKGHLIVADLKRAIFGGDLTLGGMLAKKDDLAYRGRAIGVRPDGGDVIAASISIAVTMVDNLATP